MRIGSGFRPRLVRTACSQSTSRDEQFFKYIFPKLYEEVLIKSANTTAIFAEESADSAVFVSLKNSRKIFPKVDLVDMRSSLVDEI